MDVCGSFFGAGTKLAPGRSPTNLLDVQIDSMHSGVGKVNHNERWGFIMMFFHSNKHETQKQHIRDPPGYPGQSLHGLTVCDPQGFWLLA